MEKGAQRLFVAIEAPEFLVNKVTRVQNYLRPLNLFKGTFTDPDHTHATIVFLGGVDVRNIDEVRTRLRAVKTKPITVTLGNIAYLPSPKQMRVIVLDLLSEGLIELAEKCRAALGDLAPQEDRPFRPHVTVARVKYIADDDREKLRKALSEMRIERVSFTVKDFVLERSSLTSVGPEHYTLERYKLMA